MEDEMNDIAEIFDDQTAVNVPSEAIDQTATVEQEPPKRKRGRPKKSETSPKVEKEIGTDIENLKTIERIAFIATLKNITAVFGEKWKMSDEEAEFCGGATIDFLDRYFPNWRIESVLLNFVAAWSLYFTRRINFGAIKRKFFRK